MENTNQTPGVIFPNDGQTPSSSAFAGTLDDPQGLSAAQFEASIVPQMAGIIKKQDRSLFGRIIRRVDVIAVLLLIFASLGLVLSAQFSKQPESSNANNQFAPVEIPLNELNFSDQGVSFDPEIVTINGALVIAPSLQPSTPTAGQIYFDQTSSELAYYNGARFVPLGTKTGVQSLGGLSGEINVGVGLSVVGGQLSNSGVLSVQGQTGNVTLTAGNGVGINGTTIFSTGVVSVASSTPSITVATDASGNVVLSGTGAGTVSSPGGTVGRVPFFTGSQQVSDSLLAQSGTTITVNGDLNVTGSLSVSNPLTVSNGGTGATSLAANGVIIGAGTSALTSVAAGGAGLCFMSTAGAPNFAACPGGGGGVTSLNGLTGALSVANASGAGVTITIDNASTAAKGIASFNAANFTASSGAVNTIQDINSGATPTFVGVNTNTITPSAALTVGISAQTALLQGSTTTITSSGAGNDIVLNSADTIELQDNTNVTGNLVVSGDVAVNGGDLTSSGALNITPGGTLTAGVSGQTLTLQGNASTSLRATNAGNTTIIGFVNPVANTTLNFPALSAGTYTICTSSGNCPSAGATLQSAYDNSTSPEIVLDATRGAVTVRDSLAGLGANLLEVQNNAGSTTYLAATTAGIVVTGTAIVSGNINSSGGALQTGNTTRIDVSGNASNIGSLTLSGAISGGTTYSGSGNINTTGGVIQTNSTTRIDNSGNLTNIAAITASGNAAIQGGTATLGTAAQQGSLVLHDGNGQTATISVGSALVASTALAIPTGVSASDTFCLLTLANCVGTGGGVSGSGTNNQLAKFTSTGSTIGDSSITDDGTTVTTTGDLVIQGGDTTIGQASTQTGTLNFAHSGSAFLGSIVQGALTGNRTYTLPDSSGTLCNTSGNCLGGGGGGANTALSNLTGVAINTSLLPGAAGTVNLGSGTLPFGDIFLAGTSGTPGTNNFRITGASTSGTRVITLPDATGTVCLQSSTACGFAPASGSANYIQNQTASDQVADFQISGSGIAATFNATTGINTGAGDGTQRLDTSGNLNNIGTLTLAGAISGGTTYTGSGNINTTAGNLQTNSITRVDVSGNLTNIGNITGTGAITIASTGAGNDIVINGADILDVQDAASFASTLGVNGTATLSGDAALNGATITIGDATTDLLTIGAIIQGASPLVFEGGVADANELTFTIAGLTGDRTVTFPDATGDVCLTSGNCSGVGGGVTTPGGTPGAIPVFTGAQAIGDSSITDNGTTVSTTGDLVIQGGDVTVGAASSQTGRINFAHSGSAFLGTIVQGALGANRTYTLPDASGIICTDSGNCLGGGGGGANTALSNLTAVAINTTLLPGAAGTINLGSGTLPFGDVFLAGTSGTPGTNNFRITGASTSGTRTITLPDASGTVCLQNSTACGFAPASGSTNYIQNQTATDQTADFQISGSGIAATFNATTGINTGAGDGTLRLDASGNLSNIGTLTLSGAISGGTTYSGSGNINTTGGVLQTNSITRVDNSGNLTNIGNLTGTGAITIASTGAGNDVIINGADILDVQDAASFASTLGVTGTTTLSGDAALNGTNLSLGDAVTDLLTVTAVIQGGSPLVFEGGTADAHELTIAIAALTGDQTITFPNATGDVCLTSGNCSGSGSSNTLQAAYEAGNTINTISARDIAFNLTDQATDPNFLVDLQCDTACGANGRFAVQDDAVDILSVAPTSVLIGSATTNVPVTVSSGTGAINIGNGAQARSVNVGTGAAAQTVTVGSTDTTSTTLIQGGSGNVTVNSGGTIELQDTTNVTGGVSTTSTITLGALGTTNTATYICRNSSNILAACNTTGTGAAFVQGGNSFGATATLGTNDANGIDIETNNVTVATISSTGAVAFLNQTNSAAAFRIQTATAAETLFTADTANRGAGGGNLIKIGNSTGTDTATTILQLDGTTADPSTNLAALNGGLFYDSTTHKVKLIENGQVKIICNTTDLGCGTGTVTLQSAYGNGNTILATDNRDIDIDLADTATDPNFLVDLQCDTSCSTNGRFAIQDDGSDIFTVSPAAAGITMGNDTLNTPLTLNSGTGTIAIGTGAQARTINVGTGAAVVQTINVGGTGANVIAIGNTQTGGSISLGAAMTSGTISIGGTGLQTGTISLGTGTGAQAINLGTGGTGAKTVTLGSTSTGSVTNIQGDGGTANGDINIGDQTTASKILDLGSVTNAGTGTVNIATSTGAAQTVNIGSTAASSALNLNAGSSNAVLNATSGTVTLQTTTTGQINIKPGGSSNIVLGTSDTTGTLLILDNKTGSGDPTGVVGGMYYNGNLGKFRCFEYDYGTTNGFWRDCMASARTGYYYANDMFTGVQDSSIVFTDDSSGGGINPGINPEVGRPGLLIAGTGTSGGFLLAGHNASTSAEIVFGNGDYWRYDTALKIPSGSSGGSTNALSTAGQSYVIRAGFAQDPTVDGTNGCFMKYTHDVNSGKWQGVCVNGGSSTTCDTTISVALDTWYRLTVAVNSAGTSADFQVTVSGTTTRCQVASNIPTSASNATGWFDAIDKTSGTGAGTDRWMTLDYIEILGQLGTSR